MGGIILAFKNYKIYPKDPTFLNNLIHSKWVGLDNFKFLFTTGDSWIMIRNTLAYNIVFIILCCIIPFIFVVIISFSSEESIRTIGYSFWPMAWSTDTYAYAFEKLPQIWRSFFNSILITGIGTVLSTLICVLYSYALYRPDFKYRNFFNFFSFFVMLFGGGLVPTHIISKQVLGLSENYAALIVLLLASTPSLTPPTSR